jgi:hypothetical protein
MEVRKTNFMSMHFRGNANEMLYGSPNLVNPSKKVFHIQDFSHNVKKLRNSILKSGVGKWQIGNRKPVNPIKDIWITSVAKCGANLLSHKILRFCASSPHLN